jgi:hypothetical protein
MALEDFVTPTEIKDGIAAISRVKELVDIINNEKDSVLKNIDDTMRHWSNVAKAIAATDKRECLDLFINLDGIHFIDTWLNDVQKVGTEKSESFVEESILELLRAVEKLRLDNQKSVSSGISMTVKNLIGHSNSAVDERAKALFDSWKEDSMEIDVGEKKVTDAADDDKQKQFFEKPPESSLEARLDATKLHDGAMEISEKLDEKEENIEFKIKEDPCLKASEGNIGRVGSESANQEKEDEQSTFHNHISSVSVKEEKDDDDSSSSDEVEGNSSGDSDIFKPVTDSKKRDVEHKRSNIEELDYGMVDPLELARQVAIEVEREMDCREASCSSSDKRPNSPNSSNGKLQSQTDDSPSEKVETSLECSAGSPPENDVESSPVTTAVEEAKEVVEEKEKGFCDFDLNEDVCSVDTDEPLNRLSTPVSVVSASRATAATGSPAAPLQFEGTFGFKGPTATSAFRPASPRRSNEGSNSKQRSDFLDFDLNVAEYGDDKAPAELANQIPFSSALLSGESSVEASSRRLDLDLNLVSDGGDAPPLGRLFRLNSPSPSSSSSTMQPLVRNIDLNLNDQSSFFNDSSDHRSFFSKSYQNSTPRAAADESVISIMGARVEVNRRQNGRITMDPLPDLSLARAGSVLGLGSSSYPYTHTPINGYNTTGPGPTIPMYGPASHIPYMVDSRGSHPFGQQQQPHFFIPSSSNGAGPSGHGFDLNTGGLMMMEGGGNRDTTGLRQFLNPPQLSLQPGSSSSSSGKRKEPDGGWGDPYPFNYKHHQSPWK